MKRYIALPYLLVLTSAIAFGQNEPRVFLMDPAALSTLRTRISASHYASPALDHLRIDAARAMKLPSLSVTQKHQVPPSGSKHDYMSLAPYWWPDPHAPHGLPYIRRDGERNPEIYQFEDHKHFGQLMSAVRTLGLAYYLFGDEKYADKATELLRTWFIDPATRMNPNLNFAQAVLGRNQGRGTGLIETRGFADLVDGIDLLQGSRAWTAEDQRQLVDWCSEFLKWLVESDNGKAESHARNNHGSFYDVQVTSLAMFTGQTDLAKRVLREVCHKRIRTQIGPDGREPLELVRTKSFSYSVFNLEALFELAQLGDRVGVDLWNCEGKHGGGIRAALDFLSPYAAGAKPWPYKQIEPIDGREVAQLLVIAAARYSDPDYATTARQIDPEIDNTLTATLWMKPGSESPTRTTSPVLPSNKPGTKSR